jgi:hypothetical protein
MAPQKVDLESRPCADIPEFQRFVQQAYRRDQLIEQTGGGEAFVAAAMPMIRKNVIQALPYASPSSKYVHELRRMGVADQVLDRALAQAWLDGADEFRVPRARKRDFLTGTLALLAYSVTAVVVGLFEAVTYLRHAHPDIGTALIAVPPLLALAGVPLVVLMFMLLRKIVHRS